MCIERAEYRHVIENVPRYACRRVGDFLYLFGETVMRKEMWLHAFVSGGETG